MDYHQFIKNKSQIHLPTGIDRPNALNRHLFDYQHDVTSWALRRGRAAIFAGTGLGKTLMELAYSEKVAHHTGKPVLIVTPLAVANQFIDAGYEFGIEVRKAHSQDDITTNTVYVSNYQKVHRFNMNKFGGIVLDESSILKNHTGSYRNELIKSCESIPFRLAATATPSPNDYMELGNHAEFLGIMSYTDMLSTFFVHDGSSTQNWRLKGHAEEAFWKWMATWSVMFQSPDDLGYDGSKHKLPSLYEIQHTVSAAYAPCIETGMLFPVQAKGLSERLKVRRASISERCDAAADLANGTSDPIVIWCNLNDESSALVSTINGAVEVKGADSDIVKENRLAAFANGDIRVLVTKPSICGFGMNWQHCNKTIFMGLNDSFEQVYQAIRRFWRFGQKNDVTAHFIASELEGNVVANLRRKQSQSDHMMQQMVKQMAATSRDQIKGAVRDTASYKPQDTLILPTFMRA